MGMTYADYAYANGSVPAAVLRPLDEQPEAFLRMDAADAWNRGRAEVLARTGIDLRVRGWNRTLAEQERFFFERYEPQSVGGGPYGDVRWYKGVRYVRVRGAAAAIPGTSNHGWGLAVDVNDYGMVGQFDYPRRVATFPILAKHGWTETEGRSVIQEPWHLVYDPARDTHPPQEERDDMFSDEDRALLRRVLEEARDASTAAGWVKSRVGGTVRRNEQDERVDPPLSEHLDVIRGRLTRALSQAVELQAAVTALTSAVTTLAESQGLDQEAVLSVVDIAARDALSGIQITLTTEESE